ncbi:HEAT repeat domain-containing protein [Labrenzia sp. PHM005]|uniref:HEAT repeat domain-containing protein n=1 Tax=Labrenzia sp. PHM005 TaxID=2590016 RepID=UPI00113FDD9E|nr:HEAT repeat domain-containing protein [Labrenzia sp. PHM005]QDG76151.1 hypothetical protein FJ695_09870 [Labrenzia sp. PHM005]
MYAERRQEDPASELELFKRHLTSGNDVVRNMAVRAIPVMDLDPDSTRQALIEALQDPDPDTRADAMELFASLANLADAPLLRDSLTGDPVREVKLAAISGLARLKDQSSVPLLRRLVTDHCNEHVAWEDEAGDWEDWLDIQIAAIGALGQLQAVEAVDDLMAARADEFGQDLDIAVFNALGQMVGTGVEKLLDALKRERGLSKTRVVQTLGKLAPHVLQDHCHLLIASDEPLLRQAAIPLLGSGSADIERLIKDDPDPAVRITALRHAHTARPDLVVGCLIDPDQPVQAAALELVELPLPNSIQSALGDNMQAWLKTAALPLKMAATRRLADVIPDQACELLCAVIEDQSCPLECRLQAVEALENPALGFSVSELRALLSNPAQQVRVKVLTALKSRAAASDRDGIEAIADAIAGVVLKEAGEIRSRSVASRGLDASTPKDDAIGKRNIIITEDGDIVETDTLKENAPAGQSTLSSILKGNQPEPFSTSSDALPKGTHTSAKDRKRRPVEGPDAASSALRKEAIRACADLAAPQIRSALVECLDDPQDELVREAWVALEQQNAISETDDDLLAAAKIAFGHKDPVIRLAAFKIIAGAEPDAGLLAAALIDEDALMRAAAVQFVAPEEAILHLGDQISLVRTTALTRVLTADTPKIIGEAAEILISAERIDTLSKLLSTSAGLFRQLKHDLLIQEWPPKRSFIVLSALAQMTKEKSCLDIIS